MTHFDTVLFDLDGTLLDERVNLQGAFYAAARSLYDLGEAEFGLPAASALARRTAAELWAEHDWVRRLSNRFGLWSHDGLSEEFPGPAEELGRLREWLPTFRTGVWTLTMAGLRMAPDAEIAAAAEAAFVTARHQGALRPYAGALDLLRSLSGRRLAICTNGPADGQRRKARRAGLSSLVGTVVASTTVDAGKPDIAVIAAALDELGAPYPCNAVFVGDIVETDAGAALGCGFPAIIVWPLDRGAYPYVPHPWVRLCRSLAEVPALMEALERELGRSSPAALAR